MCLQNQDGSQVLPAGQNMQQHCHLYVPAHKIQKIDLTLLNYASLLTSLYQEWFFFSIRPVAKQQKNNVS